MRCTAGQDGQPGGRRDIAHEGLRGDRVLGRLDRGDRVRGQHVLRSRDLDPADLTLGGQHVASNVFEFSITACKGCLIQFDTDNARTPIPNCYARAPVSAPPASVCFYGQENPSDCHVCIKDPFCLCGKASCPGGG